MKTKLLPKFLGLLLGGVLLFSSACNSTTASTTASSFSDSTASTALDSSKSTETEAEKTLSFTDREGKELVLTKIPEKIISMAPSVTETLIHLGLADKIIGIDTYSADIPGLKANLPQFDMMAPDTEALAALKPDIILATGMSKSDGDDPFKPLLDLGVSMTYIPSATSLEAIKEDIDFLGQITGTETKAAEIVTSMEKEIAELVALVPTSEAKPQIYFEIAAAPNMYSFGKNTFLNELITLAGGENILADQDSWVSVSEEVILAKNPTVIFTNVNYIDNPIEEIMSRPGWDSISAVKEKRVYQVDKNTSSRPNEFVTKGLREILVALYPEVADGNEQSQ